MIRVELYNADTPNLQIIRHEIVQQNNLTKHKNKIFLIADYIANIIN